MGEKPIVQLCADLSEGKNIVDIHDIPQTVYLCREDEVPGGISDDDIVLYSHEECLVNRKAQADNFRHIEEESNKMHAQRLLQSVDGKYAVVNPPYPPMTTEELDRSFDMPYTRLPHPKYKGKRIPAYEMIKFSVNIHRGCFGGCAFCTISAHQGKFIASRSKESILKEVKAITEMPDFKGYLSDLGGPSANMYRKYGLWLSLDGVRPLESAARNSYTTTWKFQGEAGAFIADFGGDDDVRITIHELDAQGNLGAQIFKHSHSDKSREFSSAINLKPIQYQVVVYCQNDNGKNNSWSRNPGWARLVIHK
jgi:hypothetical protein